MSKQALACERFKCLHLEGLLGFALKDMKQDPIVHMSHLNDALRLTKNAINYSHSSKMQATSLQHSALHRSSQVRPELHCRRRPSQVGNKELTHRTPFAGLQLLLCFNDGIAQ